ncbi:long-chain fatty acid--CoA ligase [Baekduia soli]|uniref:Long-chain fatty acid--CoA ligase n=1 Tax=Baekduia soli TaxID=496014 RepID=A0A5B8U0B0_9ACTN|nr:class I adenylate-forming enzyme family protein [Baekduia soli]QEC46392.1 long-chain fatty acid--CoA ligase [Baekduia soli]
MTELTFREFWEQRVALTPDAPFVHHDADTWTYSGFDASINRLANGMRAAGIGAGSKVGLYLANSFELLRRQWALQKLGAIWVPIIPSSTRSEALYVLEHAGVDALIAGAEQWNRLAEPGWAARAFVEDGGPTCAHDVGPWRRPTRRHRRRRLSPGWTRWH